MPRNYTPRACEQCESPYDGDGIRFCSKRCEGLARSCDADRHVWDFIDKSGPCWLWTGRTYHDGYGRTTHHQRAHRWAFEQASGIIVPAGMFVCHDCPSGDDPLCVRNDEPDIKIIRGIARPKFGHLWLGTPADNTADMIQKERRGKTGLTGARHHKARLTELIVLEIRARHAEGERIADLARLHRVQPPAVHKIVHRLSWTHI